MIIGQRCQHLDESEKIRREGSGDAAACRKDCEYGPRDEKIVVEAADQLQIPVLAFGLSKRKLIIYYHQFRLAQESRIAITPGFRSFRWRCNPECSPDIHQADGWT